jgi:phosphopantothenoylcysteine decarboxylase
MHIELRRWADVFVIAPLSANSLAKLANGMCDNLVTCIARAWDFKRPLLVSGSCKTLMAVQSKTGDVRALCWLCCMHL